MKKKTLIITIAAVCVVAIGLAAVLVLTHAHPLVGTWNTTIGGDAGQMILRNDGTGEVVSNGVSRPCTWEVKDNTLTVEQDVKGVPYVWLDAVTYEMEGKVLTVTSQNGNILVFEKE